MFIKICANTNLEDARLAADLGVDAVGFVFAPSKRQVVAAQAAEITSHLPAGLEKVGVFAANDPREIARSFRSAALTAVQLHGEFDSAMVRPLAAEFRSQLKIIQAVAYAVDAMDRVAADEEFERELKAVFNEPAVWAVLIDAEKSGASGGLGVAFDWAHVAEIVQRATRAQPGDAREPHPRIILAGGLNAKNVAQAIEALQPWGVDVASGVEASPGKKDPARLREFVEAVRSAAR